MRKRIMLKDIELLPVMKQIMRQNTSAYQSDFDIVFELDYQEHLRHVKDTAIKPDGYILHYENGDREQPMTFRITKKSDTKLGQFLGFEAKASDEDSLRMLLSHEKNERSRLVQADINEHIEALHKELIMEEKLRLMRALKNLKKPNSSDHKHFVVPISNRFLKLASDEDLYQLSSDLSCTPFKYRNSNGTLRAIHAVFSQK